jgi:PmbA protein
VFAGEIVEKLKEKFDAVEVYIEKSSSKEFELKNSKDYSKGMNADGGCGIRIIKDNKTAFAYSSLKHDLDLNRISDELYNSVEFSKELDGCIMNKVSLNVNNEKKLDVDEESIKEKIYFMDSLAKNFDDRIVDVKSASIGLSHKSFEIANSYGVSSSDSKTYVSASLDVLAKDKNVDAGWYSLDSSNFNSLNFEFLAKKAANMAINKLYPVKISTKKYSIVFANHVFVQIFAHFFPIFDAYSLINHTTALEDKINRHVFSSNITIKDAAYMDNRPNSVSIDDEGSKRNDTVVVENGVLRSFLHNIYTSNKLNQENTHNAKRSSWMSLPKVGAFNFYIEGDSSTDRDKLLNKIDGVYVTEIMGLHMANSISGDFSFGVNGFLIHDGELVSYFKSATLADNFFNMMNRVIGLSNSMYFNSSFGCPDIAIADCTVGGEG